MTEPWNELDGLRIDEEGNIHVSSCHLESIDWDGDGKPSASLTMEATQSAIELKRRWEERQKKPKPRFLPKYSGESSREFWDAINALPNAHAVNGPYDWGVRLQSVEEAALRVINRAIASNPNPPVSPDSSTNGAEVHEFDELVLTTRDYGQVIEVPKGLVPDCAHVKVRIEVIK